MKPKLIKLIENIVEQKLALTEAFQSNLMRELSKYKILYYTKGRYGGIGDSGNSIMSLLPALNIYADDVTDDMIIKKPSGGYQFSRQNPEWVVIVVTERWGDKYIANIFKSGQNVRLSGRKQNYKASWDMDSAKNPRDIRKNKDSYMSWSSNSGGSSRDDKTGLASINAMTNNELNDLPFFAVLPNTNSKKAKPFNKDYNASINARSHTIYRDIKRNYYANAIKEMRAGARQGLISDELVELGNRLLNVGELIKIYVEKSVANPQSRSSMTISSRYGSGRNERVSVTDMLEMYHETFNHIKYAEADYKNGEKDLYNYSWIKDRLSTLEKFFRPKA